MYKCEFCGKEWESIKEKMDCASRCYKEQEAQQMKLLEEDLKKLRSHLKNLEGDLRKNLFYF